jgi:hypothetical protein
MTRWIAKAQIRFHVGMKMGRQRSNFVWFTKKTKNKKQKTKTSWKLKSDQINFMLPFAQMKERRSAQGYVQPK